MAVKITVTVEQNPATLERISTIHFIILLSLVFPLQAVTKQYVDKFKFVINTYKGENSGGNTGTKKVSIGFRPRFLIIAAGSLRSLSGTGGATGYIGDSVLGDLTWTEYSVSHYTLQYLDDGVIVGSNGNDSSLPDLNNSYYTYIYFAVP